ncbi:hypothetical protein [Larkinella rosea]|uniref:PD-(D/E)XK endonuclease-like domain-containing protein n=1 Tax=Larkinella rosea TaxID=2025312 RepID=A0A3P1BV95_9BACT|nr:hypothetical protein [Larkinella rosea]RRB04922.1 hypothetical protein EHT25_15810 [Larkinella rosea]
MIKYRFYPTLLNTFSRYLSGGNFTMQQLLDTINRVQGPATVAQERGVRFEDAVIKGEEEERFNPDILEKFRRHLPRPIVETQVYCQYEIDDVLFYGYVDLIGKFKAVDIKTTASYQHPRFAFNHQNLYLHALKKRGIRLMEYLITDFKEVYVESYSLTHPIEKQLEEIRLFKQFLEEHRELISDPKIFVNPE